MKPTKSSTVQYSPATFDVTFYSLAEAGLAEIRLRIPNVCSGVSLRPRWQYRATISETVGTTEGGSAVVWRVQVAKIFGCRLHYPVFGKFQATIKLRTADSDGKPWHAKFSWGIGHIQIIISFHPKMDPLDRIVNSLVKLRPHSQLCVVLRRCGLECCLAILQLPVSCKVLLCC